MLLAALTAAVGSQTFLSPCVHEDGTLGACHWAGQALLGTGSVLGVLALMALCLQKARFGVYLSAVPVCILGILTPGTLMGLCRMSTMRCRMVMQPAMILLFSVCLVCALAGAAMNARK